MFKVILSGATGAMGRVLAARAKDFDIEVAAGLDRVADPAFPFPIYTNPEGCREEADAVIDFSHPSFLPALLDFCTGRGLPVVVATTGMAEEDYQRIRAAAEKIPVFFTFNMSLGVNLLTELARKAAGVLGDGFDIEIVEQHHNRKIDAPSGTAIMIANAVSGGTSYDPEYVYDRHSVRKRREKNEIGIHSIRGGTIVGEHEVIFAGTDEIITLSHSARSKDVFAVGAFKAAKYIKGRAPGLYDMKNLIEDS
ncbi:MAG TPA: 4-hydroxy-tetrahydrodipicolinate reductase [Candidatus Fimivivens faecavium]|nr:4-hydroxy-tetrahydrodipicolinate reductase [Candidatus Fimivivens faecavium]